MFCMPQLQTKLYNPGASAEGGERAGRSTESGEVETGHSARTTGAGRHFGGPSNQSNEPILIEGLHAFHCKEY